MTQHPDDRPEGERPDPDADTWWPTEDQDLTPAIDRREASPPGQDDHQPVAPPLDIDARDNVVPAAETPDVIELPEHVDTVGAPDLPDTRKPATWSVPVAGPSSETRDDSLADDSIEWGSEPPADIVDDDERTSAPSGPATEPLPDPEPDDEVPPPPLADPPPPPTPEPATGDSLGKRATAGLSGVASKLGLGRLLATDDDEGAGGKASSPGPRTGLGSLAGRLGESVRAPVAMFTTASHRRLLAGGFVLVLISLLGNSGGLALIVLSAIVPIMIAITLTQHDVFEKESNLLVAAVGAGGLIVGVVLSLLSAWIQSSQWFDEGVLNFGAAGFGGRFADAAGAAPFVVWSLVGLVIPAVAIAGVAAIPIALRRWPQFRNEVMDGVILTGASAAGFAIGASVIYWWPMIAEPGPQTNVSDWSLSIIGVSLLRPALITFCGAMIGAGVWRYMVTPSASVIVLPAAGGVLGYLLLTFGSIQLQAAGNWPEFLWAGVLLAAVFPLFRRVLDGAIVTDRQALGDDDGRLVCPACHRVTPTGAFCARCGKPLSGHAPASDVSPPSPIE